MALLIDVIIVGIIILFAFIAFIFVFGAWLKDRRVLKNRYKELAEEGKKSMDESPLIG